MPDKKIENELDENVKDEKLLKYRVFYPSFTGKKIVNARYGNKYDWYPSSIDSLRLFKVIDSTAQCDKKGFNLTKKEEVYREPHFLYYDTPEQYARHKRVKITNEMVLNWHEKQKLIFPDGVFSREGYNEWKNRNI